MYNATCSSGHSWPVTNAAIDRNRGPFICPTCGRPGDLSTVSNNMSAIPGARAQKVHLLEAVPRRLARTAASASSRRWKRWLTGI